MKIKTSLIALIILVASCKQKEEKYEGKRLCEITKKIIDDDQKYRGLIQSLFFEVLDSIKKSNKITDLMYMQLPKKEQLSYGKIAREIANKSSKKHKNKDRDSLMALQILLDNKNTELLIDIIETRGLPNKDNSICKDFPGHIFVHSQKKYHKKIEDLIEIENNKGNMNSGQYKFIKYHLNGRNADGLIKKLRKVEVD